MKFKGGVALAPLLSAAVAAPPGVSEGSQKQILAVLDTFKDILSSIESDGKKEKANYDTYIQWCDEETKSNAKSTEVAQQQNEDSTVSVKELTASEETLAAAIDSTGQEIQEAQDTLAQASNVRNEDNEKFSNDFQVNTQSNEQVTQAIKIVSKNSVGFLQQGGQQRVQLNAPGESNYVVGIMKGIKERLGKTGKEMQDAEDQAQQRHDQLVASEKARISALQEAKNKKREEHTEARVNLVEAGRLVDESTDQLKELQMVTEETKMACDSKKEWWKARTEDREKEKAALKEAIDAFPELLAKLGMSTSSSAAFLANVAPQSFLQVRRAAAGRTSAQSHTAVLLGAADAQLDAMEVTVTSATRKSAMDSAKKVVSQLTNVLEEEQDDESKKKDYCEAKLSEKDNEKMGVQKELRRLEAMINRKESDVDMLKGEVDDINEALDEMQVSLNEATDVRKSEKKLYEDGTKDRLLAEKVLAQAKQILGKFYKSQDKAGLLQAPPSVANPGSGRQSLRSQGALGLLDMVREDIAEEQKAAESQEKQASGIFSKLQADSRIEFDDQMQEIIERKKLRAKTLVQLGTDKELQSQKTEDKSSISNQLQALHDECDQLLSNFEKRTKARQFEIAQLKDVMDILSGASGMGAGRSGLLEVRPEDSLDVKEARLLQDMNRAANGLVANK